MSTLAPRIPAAAPAPETAAGRLVARVRGAWRRAAALRGAAWAAALALPAAAALVLLDLLVPLPAGARTALRWLPPLLAAGTLVATAARLLRPPDPRRLALLAEERVPALGNRLATLLDAAASAGEDGPVRRAFLADAERRLSGVDPGGIVPLRLRRPLVAGLVGAAPLLLLALLFPETARASWERWAAPEDAYASRWTEARAEVLPVEEEAEPLPVFDELRWRVEPPAYAGLPAREGRGSDGIAALPGSRVTLRSRFAGRWSEVRATRVGGGALPVRREGEEWRIGWTQGAEERGVVLEAVAGDTVADRRVVPLAVVPDRPPVVTLETPGRDLVLPSSHGRLTVRAAASDDHGLGGFELTWIRSRGTGELFEFEDGRWAWERVRREGGRTVGERTLDLAALDMQPGETLHLRAVARDRNDATGPGEGVSRTRVVRIAKPGEEELVDAVLVLPPIMPEDPILSQRMLLLLTERLAARAPRMEEAALRRESAELGGEQGRLRERVGEQIFVRATAAMQDEGMEVGFTEEGGGPGHDHEGGEDAEPASPEEVLEAASEATGTGSAEEVEHRHDEEAIIDVDRTRKRIFDLMWSAERRLNQASPDSAIPFQREALELIQQTRTAERVFARGRVSVDPIDVAAARGEGEVDEAAPARRASAGPRPSAAPLAAAVDAAFERLEDAAPRDAALALSALAERALAADAEAGAAVAGLLARASRAASAGDVDEARRLLLRARLRLAPSGGPGAPPLAAPSDAAGAEYLRRIGGGG